MPLIDLHVHSLHSDGTFTVEERIRQAKRRKLALVALTDHDTVAGIPQFLRLARAAKVPAVSGAEISADFHGTGVHILAYRIPLRANPLLRLLRAQSEDRVHRARKAVKLLRERGFRISFADIRREARGNIGKPHMAKAILANVENRRLLRERYGFSGGWGDLIDRFFDHPGQEGHVSLKKHSAADVIRLIRRAGGVPVLAHPGHSFRRLTDIRDAVHALRRAGLAGIEVRTPFGALRGSREYSLRLAERLGLLVTGGTDNHETTALGVNIPEKQFQALLRRLRVN